MTDLNSDIQEVIKNLKLSEKKSLNNIYLQLIDEQDEITFINLDVRATQTAAVSLYESLDYTRWGENKNYAIVDGEPIVGFYYTKRLKIHPKRNTGRLGSKKIK